MHKLYFRKIFSDNYTDVMATSRQVARVMQRSFDIPKEKIRIMGEPRCDVIFEAFDRENVTGKLFKDEPLPEYDKLILYAPTYRRNKPVTFFPFEDFEAKELEEFLEKNRTVLFIRTHSFETADASAFQSKRVRLFNEDKADDIMEYLSMFDLLITDYSSIYIDYLMLERPMVFLPYDLEEYEKEHGFNFSYDAVTPGDRPGNFRAFKKSVENAFAGQYDKAKQNSIRDFFHLEKGPCCSKICDLIKKESEEL